jgi:CheY-like chemotaxis protein
LLISADDGLRDLLRVALGAARRRTGTGWDVVEAKDGLQGLKLAWRELPDVVVADEIASGAGAFAVAKDLRGAERPFPGVIVIILARSQDAWLAKWSGADAWLERPLDAFALSDTVMQLTANKETA